MEKEEMESVPVDSDLLASRGDDFADKLAEQFAEALHAGPGSQAQHLETEIDIMLAKISDYIEIVETIRADTKIGVTTTMPAVSEKAKELELIFKRIDALEAFVHEVEATLTKLEQQADFAESKFNTFNSFKKKLIGAFSSIGRKHQDTSPSYQRKPDQQVAVQHYEPVDIFKTEDFFRPPAEISQQPNTETTS